MWYLCRSTSNQLLKYSEILLLELLVVILQFVDWVKGTVLAPREALLEEILVQMDIVGALRARGC